MRLMEAVPEAFLTYGGHHASGGFSVSHELIHTLQDALIGSYNSLHDDLVIPRVVPDADAEIVIHEIDEKLLRGLDMLAPYGMGNPKPLFKITNAEPYDVQVFGKTKNHTKLKFKTRHGWLDAICFFKLPHEFSVIPEKNKPVQLLAHIEKSFFMGRLETRLRIVDVV